MNIKEIKKPELLAPAGSFEKAKIAFMYGADAVYCGTSSLSLRTRAEMQDNNLEETIKYAHSIGKRVHTAINIFAFDKDYEEIEKQAKMLEKLKVDAIIVADGGVVDALKQFAPSIPLHISTQANSVSYHDAIFWYKNGAKRIILARELNKKQIKDIMENKPEDLEIEMFGHGAICFSYSGRCFLSQYLSDRSANLGDCSQSCRWSYNVYVEEANNPGNLMPVEADGKGTHVFSSKDLCLLKEIPEIILMKLDSLKIEGRLKTEYYLASVVNTYRSAIDDAYDKIQEAFKDENKVKLLEEAYLDGNNDKINEIIGYDYSIYMNEIEKTKTRGLTTFYFNSRENKDIQEYDGKQYNLDYEFGGKVISTLDSNDGNEIDKKLIDDKDLVLIEIRNKLSVGDDVELIVPNLLEPKKFKIEKLLDSENYEEIDTINPGVQGQTVLIKIPYKVEKNWVIRHKKNK